MKIEIPENLSVEDDDFRGSTYITEAYTSAPAAVQAPVCEQTKKMFKDMIHSKLFKVKQVSNKPKR